MNKIKQSIAWWALGQKVPAAELIAQAKRIGYEGVEMCPKDTFSQVVDGGLKIITMTGHESIPHGLNRRENHDRIEKEILANLEMAQEWHIPCLIVFSGNRAGLPDAAGLEHTVEGLQRVSKAAEQAGVTLIMELLNSKVNHADYQCDHTAWGAEVCKAVNSPSVKLLYDIYHMQIMEGDLIRTLTENIAQIGHFHTAGNPGRHEIDDSQEICYPPIMKAIAAAEYNGYVGQEFTPTGDLIAALEQAYKICNV